MEDGSINLGELRVHLDHAKSQVTAEKHNILKLYPLTREFNREEYAFAYKRAERLGLRAIARRLTEIAWLPMQLDARAEIITDDDHSMKRWLKSSIIRKPNSDQFGNDFIHALARTGINCGWDSDAVKKISARIAQLFRDLSCLIGLIYYSTWLAEHGVESFYLSNPKDLTLSVEEIAALVESPRMLAALKARDNPSKKKKKEPVVFHVIHNDAFAEPFHDPLPI